MIGQLAIVPLGHQGHVKIGTYHITCTRMSPMTPQPLQGVSPNIMLYILCVVCLYFLCISELGVCKCINFYISTVTLIFPDGYIGKHFNKKDISKIYVLFVIEIGIAFVYTSFFWKYFDALYISTRWVTWITLKPISVRRKPGGLHAINMAIDQPCDSQEKLFLDIYL